MERFRSEINTLRVAVGGRKRQPIRMKHLQNKTKVHSDDMGAVVKAAVGAIKSAMATVPGLLTLKKGERKTILKMHTGGERYILAMAVLAEQYPRVGAHGVEPKEMRQRPDVVTDLGELRSALALALQQVDDAILVGTGKAWHDAFDIYSMAEAIARREPEMHASIAPMEQFLATGPRARPTASVVSEKA